MKKIITFLLIFGLITNIVYSSDDEETECEYLGQIEQCMSSQDSHRSIEDFVCVQGTEEKVTYQIILDEKFREIDKEIKAFLTGLDEAKDYYFGPNKKENYIKGVDMIEQYLGKYGFYEMKYQELCSSTGENSITSETIKCLGGSISNDGASELLMGGTCELLYKTKLSVYKDIAYNTLKVNKQKVFKDSHKLFTQDQRRKYDDVLDLIRINIGYVERIWMKWPTKTKNAH